ncbi:MAG: ferredoxin--NADP reductase [Oligoflexales bacterium]
MQDIKWFKAQISAVIPVGTYYRIIRVAKPTQYFYIAGQHTLVKFSAQQDPELVFSFASHPDEEHLEFCVINTGISPQEDAFKPGAYIFLSNGQGHFLYKRTSFPDLVFIAGGSGIAPIRSLLKEALVQRTSAKIHLLFGCRHKESFPYAVELLDLKHKGKISEVRLTAEDSSAPPFGRGVITQALDFISKKADYYVCGPLPLIDRVRDILGSGNVPDDNIHHEVYV